MQIASYLFCNSYALASTYDKLNQVMAQQYSIVTNHLTKKYAGITAVNDLSLSVEQGSLVAFLGVNGAGKSTTINMLTTALQPTDGNAQIAGYTLGKDDAAIRSVIGVVFQQSLLDPLLSVKENLIVRASFYAIDKPAQRIDELAALIGLTDFLDRKYGKLSGGQRRRADIARALIQKPSILFLDEPTTGLDPKSREGVWKTVANLQKDTGLTVFLTTHYMEEAERADDVYVISKGEIVAHDTPYALRSQYASDTLTLASHDPERLLKKLHNEKLVVSISNGVLVVPVDSSRKALTILKEYESDIIDFEFRHGNMDDVFLNLTDRTVTQRGG